MEKEKYIKDLEDIREIMKQSSRFISLSGWSGISAGIIALFGAFAAYRWVYSTVEFTEDYRQLILSDENAVTLLLIALATLVLAAGTGIFFTTRETRKSEQKIWNFHTQRLLINLGIPLVAGGLVCLILLFRDNPGLVPPLTLVFYGLALINASKYTLPQIRSLGILEVILGIIALQFIGNGLLFWAIGFGVLHIVYGILLPNKKIS